MWVVPPPPSPRLLEGKAVVELGSGIGVTGLLCGRMGAKSVLLTDHNDTVLKVLQRNIDEETETFKHTPGASAPSLLECEKLEWGRETDVDVISRNHPSGFDIVVGADVCYQGGSIPFLFSTVRSLMNIKRASTAPVAKTEVETGVDFRPHPDLDMDPTSGMCEGGGVCKSHRGGLCCRPLAKHEVEDSLSTNGVGRNEVAVCGGLVGDGEGEGVTSGSQGSSEVGGWGQPVFLLGYVSRWETMDKMVIKEAIRQNFSVREVLRRKVGVTGYDASVYELVPL